MFLQVSGLEIAGNDTICSLTVPGRGYTNWDCSISLLKVVIKLPSGLINIIGAANQTQYQICSLLNLLHISTL